MTFETPGEEAQYREYLAYFDHGASIVALGVTYAWSEENLQELARRARLYPFMPPDFNSSVFANIVSMARARFRPLLTRAQIMDLCAATLKVPVAQIEQSLEWTAQYMAFHDGGDPTLEHPYPPSEP